MATANPNQDRCLRLEKIYSRARDRVELMRTVDEELVDEFEFPIVQPDEGEVALVQLMRIASEEAHKAIAALAHT